MRLQWPTFLLSEASFALASAIVMAEEPATATASIAGVFGLLIVMKLLKNIRFLEVCCGSLSQVVMIKAH